MSKVNIFLNNYDNKGTKRNLHNAIRLFLKAVYPEEFSREHLEEFTKRYFSENRNHEQDVISFLKSLNGQAPLSIKLKLSCIKTFFIENDIELPQKFWKKINRKIKGSRALTLDRIPTNAELKQILLHMPIQGKALFLFLESSGMRIGELLGSNLEDISLNENPVRIQIRGEVTKSGNSRYAFISKEAHEALIEWLKVRQNYLKAASGKSHIYNKSSEDPRIFPFNSSTAYSIWKNSLHKANLNDRDKSTDREKLHPHTLRKFFRTRLGAAGIPIDVVKALMGHEGYLTEAYRKYTIEDLGKFYLKGQSALFVFTEAQELTKIRQEMEQDEKQLEKLFFKISEENVDLKNRLKSLEEKETQSKDEMRQLKLTVKSVIEKLEEKIILFELIKKEKGKK